VTARPPARHTAHTRPQLMIVQRCTGNAKPLTTLCTLSNVHRTYNRTWMERTDIRSRLAGVHGVYMKCTETAMGASHCRAVCGTSDFISFVISSEYVAQRRSDGWHSDGTVPCAVRPTDRLRRVNDLRPQHAALLVSWESTVLSYSIAFR